MASETVASLLVSLGFNSAEFDRGIGKATQQAGQLSRVFSATGKDVALAANKMGVSVGRFAGDVARLKAQLDPAGTALANYRNQMNLLRESYRLGAITQTQFVAGSQSAMAAYRANGAQVVRTNGQMQMGMQQLGFQLNDVATQFASGTRPMQIFAQQSGQVIQAVSMMAGGTGRFATFMTGPWGIALTAGIVALTPFIGKLLETAFAADKATGALQSLIDKRREELKDQNLVKDAESDLGKLMERRVQLQDEIAKRGRRNSAGQLQFVYKQQKELAQVEAQITEGRKAVQAEVGRRAATAKPAKVSTPRIGGSGGGARSLAVAAGPDAADIASRFAGDRAQLMQQYNSILASMASNAETEAEYQLRNVELQRIRAISGIQANKDYTAAQKAVLVGQQEELAEQQRAQIERDKTRRLEQEAEQVRQQEFSAQRERLQVKMQMAGTEAERQRLALEMFDLEQREQASALERIIASDTRTAAEKALASAALESLDAASAANRAAVMRQTETPGQAYLREINKTPEQINEAVDQIKIDGLEAFNDGLVDALVNFRSLGDVAQSVLKQILADLLRLQLQKSLIGPLAGMLGLGGGGSLLGSIAGVGASFAPSAGMVSSASSLLSSGLPMFAAGTNFAPGGLAIVGEQGPELVNLRRGSQVIPNHELGGLGSTTHAPTFVFPGVTNDKQAREAGLQAARRYRRELNPMRGM